MPYYKNVTTNIINALQCSLERESNRIECECNVMVSRQILQFHYDHEVHDHTTRSSTNIIRENYFDVGYVEQSFTLHTKGANNNFGKKMIQVTGPIIWNSIPEDIQKAVTIHTFKKEYKNFIFNEYAGDNNENNDINNDNNNNNNNNNVYNSNSRSNDNQRWRRTVDQPFVSRWDQ